jgi:magnesium transporter
MITILKNTELGLQTLDQPVDGCWINLVNPSPDELAQVRDEYQIPEDYLTYPLDLDERARTETDEGKVLIVLRVPIYMGDNVDIPYETAPLGIVLTERVLVTIQKNELNVVSGLINGRVRSISTNKRYRLILFLLLAAATKYLAYLREIDRRVDVLEDQLHKSLQNKEVLGLLKYQKSLTLFTAALKSNELMIARLQRNHLFNKYEEDQDLLEDVLTELQQAIEMTNISSNILSQMMDAFASIISNNLNVVMKFLASITIILSVPTLIASIYGMNVPLPLDAADHALPVLLGVMLSVMFIVLIIFRRRDWL